jgi:hypothetical protein
MEGRLHLSSEALGLAHVLPIDSSALAVAVHRSRRNVRPGILPEGPSSVYVIPQCSCTLRNAVHPWA